MHLSRSLVFSIAAAGVATATSVCNKETAQPLPESALVHYAKFDLALQEIYIKGLEKAGHWKRDRSQLLGRQAGSMFCMSISPSLDLF